VFGRFVLILMSKTVVIKTMQNICKNILVFYFTTSKNVLQMFCKCFTLKRCKNVEKHFQNIFANVLAFWTHVEDRR